MIFCYMKKDIKLAIVWLWNCASSLIQWIWYYAEVKTNDKKIVWLMNNYLWWYSIGDINVVLGIDVNIEKIWATISEAIFKQPNCTKVFCDKKLFQNKVIAWPILDWISERMAKRIHTHDIEKDIEDWRKDVVNKLIEEHVDVLVSYLPVWSKNAAVFYAECALEANVAYANAMPEFICSNRDWAKKFEDKWLPCAWDDIKSQVWATIIHRCLVDLINKRWQAIDGTYQLNVWWNTDFENMLDESRLISKRISKTEAVTSLISDYDLNTKIWPSDFIEHLHDNKVCYINIQWRQFWDIPFSVDLKLSVEDSPNSAWVMVDVIRLLKLAKDKWLKWYQDFSCYYFKHPMIQKPDDIWYNIVQDFMKKYSN